MTKFDDYNRAHRDRSYSENVRRFSERTWMSEYDIDDMQAEARRQRERRYEDEATHDA